jgi:hypothetical protein
MIRAWVTLLLLSFGALPALAQNVVVRTGEHEGFTRLVLDFPTRRDWQGQAREDGITLTFPGQSPAFDLSRAFDRLTQGRLAAIDAPDGSGQLDLTFGCACATRMFWHGGSMLVIDILTLAIPEPLPAQSRRARAKADGSAGLIPSTMTRPVSSAARWVASGIVPPPATTEVAVPPVAPVPDDMLWTARRTLLEQIAHSANHGLVEPLRAHGHDAEPPAPPTPPTAAAETITSDGMETGSEARLTKVLPSDPRGNLRVMGTIDPAPRLAVSAAPPGLLATACLPEELLDVATWGERAPLPDQIGALYPRLSGEFDVVNPEVALHLARLYIYFGFGREARQVVSLIPSDAQDVPVLLELAGVVDDPDAAPSAPRLKQDLGCSGRSALWAALAHEAIPEGKLLDHPAILRGFAELPEHLRRHLGPPLARKLLAAKHRETSDMILRGIGPTDLSGAPGEKIAKAELAIADGDFDEADQSLKGALSRNEGESAHAVSALINTRISRGEGIDYDTAQLAAALYQETRGTPVGQDLGRSYLLALTASQSYREAFSEFDRITPDLPAETARATRQEMLRLLVAQAEDLAFLRQTLNEPRATFAMIPADLTRRIVRRVLTLGFADLADELLNVAPPPEKDPDYQLLKAEIALARGRPHLAEAEIIGLASPEAAALRARARTALGDYAGAMRHAKGLEDEAALLQAAWLARDWQNLLSSDDPATRELAQAMAQTAPDKSGGVLSFNRQLIDQSVAARIALGALLARTDISNSP